MRFWKKDEPEPIIPATIVDADQIGPLTDDEYAQLMHDVTEMAIDLFYEKYGNRRLEMISKDWLIQVRACDNIVITYNLELNGNAIIQILGRMRRAEDKR